MRKELGVDKDDELVLKLRKALYGLKQAGRLSNATGAKWSWSEWQSTKFLGMRIGYGEVDKYEIDQEVCIVNMLDEYGLTLAHGVRAPIGVEWIKLQGSPREKIPVSGEKDVVVVRSFHSLVGSIVWVVQCTRQDIAFANIKVPGGYEDLKLRMEGKSGRTEPLRVVAYNDADFAAEKQDRKSVTGGLAVVDDMPISWVCEK
ncbi:hypothetical protein PC118_g20865 [Phytophthora cactorum]|uniref:Reverse transcriptase Ty1/copia-type domain-containing protein n=1 Tax=Phytophthora cactorum TaxID=29920 RepID=A0A329RD81_9STRA|nr:hypothetical protein PC118_g20865 [Phytophthora cactorum]KAG3056996.1 hypothetical protein PC122_g21178 [Phytophthora cactorum]RAW22400.1 hypothetical protein PC110_g21163 [Phytophthora cactorum]